MIFMRCYPVWLERDPKEITSHHNDSGNFRLRQFGYGVTPDGLWIGHLSGNNGTAGRCMEKYKKVMSVSQGRPASLRVESDRDYSL